MDLSHSIKETSVISLFIQNLVELFLTWNRMNLQLRLFWPSSSSLKKIIGTFLFVLNWSLLKYHIYSIQIQNLFFSAAQNETKDTTLESKILSDPYFHIFPFFLSLPSFLALFLLSFVCTSSFLPTSSIFTPLLQLPSMTLSANIYHGMHCQRERAMQGRREGEWEKTWRGGGKSTANGDKSEGSKVKESENERQEDEPKQTIFKGNIAESQRRILSVFNNIRKL